MKRIFAAAAALTLLACAQAAPRKDVVWPEAPEKPRIKFAFSVRQTADLDTGGWTSFKRGLAGGDTDPALQQPMGAAVSADGKRLYVADYAANSLVIVDFEAKRMTPVEKELNRPFNVALDRDGNVYVSESGARQVSVFDRDGRRLRALPMKDFDLLTGLAIDQARGILYLADSGGRTSEKHGVRAYDLSGKFLFALGPKEGPPGRGDADGQFLFPAYLAVDAQGQVFVADTLNFRIQVFGPDGKFVRKYGEHGDAPGAIGKVKGLAFDSLGNLYQADADHGVVQMFNRKWQMLMFFGGREPYVEYFDLPTCVAIDPRINRIYVCQTKFARINAYDLINTTADELLPTAK